MKRCLIALVVLIPACGGGAPAAPSVAAAPGTTTPAPPPAPTSWAISGRILAAGDLSPIAGATVTFGDAAPVTSGADGGYTLVTTDGSTKPLTIAAPGFFTRETSLTGGAVRTDVSYALIGGERGFPLQQYIDMVRNAFEAPTRLEPSRRWTTNPNFYIKTTWRDEGTAVRPESIAFLTAEIRRIVPQWTAGTLQAGLIETGEGLRPKARDWINIEFGRSGNWSFLGENPGQVQFGSEGSCQSLAILHELGHAMGYWHTGIRPSIMGGTLGTCSEWSLGPNDVIIARAMYAREPGNLSPDKDGPPPPPIFNRAASLNPIHSGSAAVVYCDALPRH